MNIIVKTPSFIGDTIMCLPAIELLKIQYPESKITIVCKPSSIDLFRNKNMHKIIIDDTKSGKTGRIKRIIKLIKNIREENYNLGVLFHNTFLDALIFKLSKIDKIIGYNHENRKILLDYHIKIDRTRHYVNHYCYLVNKFFDNKYTDIPKMELFYKNSNLINFKKKMPKVGFVLGGENKDTRRYPNKLSLELFNLLENENINIILLGDKDDNINNSVYEKEFKYSEKLINLSGNTTVSEFIDIIGSLDLLVTIDTSAVHIAASVNTNFILLVGKGSSALDTTYPKVDFGTIIFEGKDKIRDEDLIFEINPNKIIDQIKNIIQ